jgi:hypothetical protein
MRFQRECPQLIWDKVLEYIGFVSNIQKRQAENYEIHKCLTLSNLSCKQINMIKSRMSLSFHHDDEWELFDYFLRIHAKFMSEYPKKCSRWIRLRKRQRRKHLNDDPRCSETWFQAHPGAEFDFSVSLDL